MLLAAFSVRYDVHLVPDLPGNFRTAIHGDVAWDDRAADTALSDGPTRRTRLITTDQPLYVGAARNIGVAVSLAPYLAFLAGDCLARPGWVTGRLSQRHAGAQAVATAVVGEGDANLVALAGNGLCYASRHPDADPRHLSFYGQSYARTLLRQLGHFPPGLRVGENTALNQRFSLAQDLLSRDTSLVRAVRRAVLAVQWLASQAYRHSTPQGLAQIARAEDLAVQAMAAADPGLARQACTLDPQDAEKAVLLRHSADLPGARAAFAAAPAVDPAHPTGAEGLVAVVSDLGGPSAAWQQAEALVCAAPTMRRLWFIAAKAALAANHSAWAVGLGQVALARGVDVASGHAMLARLHKAAADPVAEGYRNPHRLHAAAGRRAADQG